MIALRTWENGDAFPSTVLDSPLLGSSSGQCEIIGVDVANVYTECGGKTIQAVDRTNGSILILYAEASTNTNRIAARMRADEIYMTVSRCETTPATCEEEEQVQELWQLSPTGFLPPVLLRSLDIHFDLLPRIAHFTDDHIIISGFPSGFVTEQVETIAAVPPGTRLARLRRSRLTGFS